MTSRLRLLALLMLLLPWSFGTGAVQLVCVQEDSCCCEHSCCAEHCAQSVQDCCCCQPVQVPAADPGERTPLASGGPAVLFIPFQVSTLSSPAVLEPALEALPLRPRDQLASRADWRGPPVLL